MCTISMFSSCNYTYKRSTIVLIIGPRTLYFDPIGFRVYITARLSILNTRVPIYSFICINVRILAGWRSGCRKISAKSFREFIITGRLSLRSHATRIYVMNKHIIPSLYYTHLRLYSLW